MPRRTDERLQSAGYRVDHEGDSRVRRNGVRSLRCLSTEGRLGLGRRRRRAWVTRYNSFSESLVDV